MIRVYVSPWCAECRRAVELLERSGLSYEAVEIECCRLHELTGGSSVPQVLVDGRPIGGYAELAAYVNSPMSRPGQSRIVSP